MILYALKSPMIGILHWTVRESPSESANAGGMRLADATDNRGYTVVRVRVEEVGDDE